MEPAIDLTNRPLFPAWTREVCRFGDTDRLGHVNNAAFATFCETGRVTFLWDEPGPPPGCAFVIARLVIDFRAELQWRDVVDIGTATIRLGRSSFTLGQGLFVAERCVATAESVLVLMDEATRRPTTLPDALRDRLAAAGPRIASPPGPA
jgi:acyl-CoA thioester hydrolase